MTTRSLRALSQLVALLRAALIGGLVVAALAFPLTTLGGLAARTGAELVQELPDLIRILPSAQTSAVYAADGKTLITQFYEEYRRYVPLSQMSTTIQHAIVASEDSRFYEHHGVDVKGVVRAFVANQRAGEVAQGASTLTMQYVRNVQRDSATSPAEVRAATEQTNARKLKEMRLAVAVEQNLTKTQILERYLNVAYFGHRAFGIYAAAEVYFSRKPRDLTIAEAATLAGLVKAPSAFDPALPANKWAALERRNYVIDRMVALSYVDAATARRIKLEPIRLRLTNPPNDCVSVARARNDWGFFCDMFKNWWQRQPAFGKTPRERDINLRRGGYTIVTTLDPRLQKAALTQVVAKEKIGSPYAHGLVAIEPGTGRIKAAAVNRIYSLDQRRNGIHMDPAKRGRVPSTYPRTVNPLLGGGDMPGYQAGSTFKVFTMVAALEAGLPLGTRIHAPMRVKTRYPADHTTRNRCGDKWCPSNASKSMTGVQNMWTGFGKSVNTFFVQLEQRVGADKAVRMAERLGLRWHTDIDRLQASPAKARGWGAFTLGVADTSPLEMANAYATLAADGRYCTPIPVLSIVGSDGKKLAAPARPQCRQAVSVEVARAAVDAARCVTGYGAARGGCGGWSTAPYVYGMVKRPVAGKTGTTDDTRAAWFVGITPTLAAAAFFADPDNQVHVAGDRNARKPTQAVANTLKAGLEGQPVRQFTPPTKLIGTPKLDRTRTKDADRSPRRRSGTADSPTATPTPNPG
jgi:membrane peptidoglycan carboxypeptidase